jgi:YhcH/YjgK/YiaL family protein
MILDSIDNGARYYALHPRLSRVFDFLRTADIKALEPGRHDIDGDNLFVNVSELELRPLDAAHLEAHNRYIDVQVVIEGEEIFGWSERKECTTPEGEFDIERDILFYSDIPQTFYTVREGQFTILYPEDAHAPMLGNGHVKKLIFKVLMR